MDSNQYNEELKRRADRRMRLLDEIAGLQEDLKQCKAEDKADGYTERVLAQCIKDAAQGAGVPGGAAFARAGAQHLSQGAGAAGDGGGRAASRSRGHREPAGRRGRQGGRPRPWPGNRELRSATP
ncbi:MAG: DUF2312 domain-containing protein [Hyphomicrobium zavarzinii]|nr:DUF2312 domain-containing protein [Hyphomicrobium zavarzinii]